MRPQPKWYGLKVNGKIVATQAFYRPAGSVEPCPLDFDIDFESLAVPDVSGKTFRVVRLKRGRSKIPWSKIPCFTDYGPAPVAMLPDGNLIPYGSVECVLRSIAICNKHKIAMRLLDDMAEICLAEMETIRQSKKRK